MFGGDKRFRDKKANAKRMRGKAQTQWKNIHDDDDERNVGMAQKRPTGTVGNPCTRIQDLQ